MGKPNRGDDIGLLLPMACPTSQRLKGKCCSSMVPGAAVPKLSPMLSIFRQNHRTLHRRSKSRRQSTRQRTRPRAASRGMEETAESGGKGPHGSRNVPLSKTSWTCAIDQIIYTYVKAAGVRKCLRLALAPTIHSGACHCGLHFPCINCMRHRSASLGFD